MKTIKNYKKQDRVEFTGRFWCAKCGKEGTLKEIVECCQGVEQ